MKLFVVFLAIFVTTSVATRNKLKSLLLSKVFDLQKYALKYLSDNDMVYKPSPDFPYWNFIPQYSASLKIGESVEWTSPCFANNKGSATISSDGKQVLITISSTGAANSSCEDLYMAITTSMINLSFSVKATIKKESVTELSLDIPSDLTDAEQWDLETKGVRLLHYLTDSRTAYSNLAKTFELFIPEFTQGVPEAVAQANIDFMSKYTHFDIFPRDVNLNVVPDEKDVHSGDSFYIMRLDGLNPMLAWAMGSTTGHVTTALWMDGELFVCESTIADSYWPTDYVQKTPYRTWINQTIAADFQVVYVPLNEDARAKYNETAAIEWFKSVEGLDYGFKTLIWGWLDTAKDNLPCLPPDFSSNCLQWELLEPLIAIIDRYVNEAGDMLWNPGYNKRLGTDGLRTAALFQEAAQQSMDSVDVISIPEQDTWLYNTTRWGEPAVGRAMVCCVFVCSTWKAAGVFGDFADSVNCAELTNWDDYALTIHGDTYQQIVGEYSLELNDFHIKAPYPHMAETCPSLAPDYVKPLNC